MLLIKNAQKFTLLKIIIVACCLFAVVFIGMNNSHALNAQEDKDNKLAIKIQQLVDQLDADERAKREQAKQALIKLGSAVLDQLPRENDDLSEQQKHSLQQIRQTLQRQFAKQSAEASLITLKSEAMPLSEILKSLSKQSGNEIVDSRIDEEDDPKLKVEFNKTPFWKALDQVLDQAELSVDPFDSGDDDEEQESASLSIVERLKNHGSRSKSAVYAGIFRMEVTTIRSVQNFRNKAASHTTATLEIAWEPRISPIAINHALKNLQVLDSQGNELAAQLKRIKQQIPIDEGVHTIQLQLNFNLPSRAAKKIASLQSEFKVLMPSTAVEMKVQQLAKTKKKIIQRGDVRFLYRNAVRNNQLWAINTEVAFDENAKKLESHLGWVYRSVAYLIDPKGKKITPAGVENWQTERGIGSTYLFDVKGDLKGYQFIYKTPTSLLELPVKFQFKDLPLP